MPKEEIEAIGDEDREKKSEGTAQAIQSMPGFIVAWME